jgi:AraC-like DNA-binding protein
MTDNDSSPILSIVHDAARGHREMEPHAHGEPMLLWASTGTIIIRTSSRDWLVPPGHGLWVPAGTEHSAVTLAAGGISIIRFEPAHCPISWPEPTGVAVSPLLRELILHLHAGPDAPARHLAEALAFELLTPLPAGTIHVPVPADPRIRPIAEQLVANPADQRELTMWAGQVHAGVRTLSRLFTAETGMTFTQWRTQVRIRAAVSHLAAGTSVSATARAVGYRKPSAFISAFHRVTGQTPGTYAIGVGGPGSPTRRH